MGSPADLPDQQTPSSSSFVLCNLLGTLVCQARLVTLCPTRLNPPPEPVITSSLVPALERVQPRH